MNDPALIEIRSLAKTFASGSETLTILSGIDLDIPRGAKVVVTGESGSGKSTFLNILGGLDSATAGTVRVGPFQLDGQDERGLTEYRSRFVGFVFQFHYLLKDFTALENVLLPAYVAGFSRKEAEERARALLSEVRMEARLSHYPSQLSGGERQRVAVARSLVNDPELVLADEPTGNLDPANSAVAADLLFSAADRHGKTLVVVTHDQRVAERGDLRFRLESGRLDRR